MLVLVVVILATLSLAIPKSESNEAPMEVSEITGEMRLSSRASMDALGLQDFQIGPLATIALDVHPIQSEGCTSKWSTGRFTLARAKCMSFQRA